MTAPEIEYLSARLNAFCNVRDWSDEASLSLEMNTDGESDSIENSMMSILRAYLKGPGSSDVNSTRMLSVIKALQPSLTNDNEDWVRVRACSLLKHIVLLNFPVGYTSFNNLKNGDACSSLQGIVQFLLARLDDLPCTEAIIDCLFTILVQQDSPLYVDNALESTQENHRVNKAVIYPYSSIPLPVQVFSLEDVKVDGCEDNFNGLTFDLQSESMTRHPNANNAPQYRWMSIKDVAFILSTLCEKLQLDYLRSKHRRQVYDIFMKYLLCDYDPIDLCQKDENLMVFLVEEEKVYARTLTESLLTNKFVQNFIICFDNERDPLNVHSFFKICLQLSNFSQYGGNRHIIHMNEDFFHSFGCFFPLMYEEQAKLKDTASSYRNSKGKSINSYRFEPTSLLPRDTSADPLAIKSALHSLLSSKCFYRLSMPFLMDKIHTATLDELLDIFDALRRIFTHQNCTRDAKEDADIQQALIQNALELRSSIVRGMSTHLSAYKESLEPLCAATISRKFTVGTNLAKKDIDVLHSNAESLTGGTQFSTYSINLLYLTALTLHGSAHEDHISSECKPIIKVPSELFQEFSRWISVSLLRNGQGTDKIRNMIKEISCSIARYTSFETAADGACEARIFEILLNFALLVGNGSVEAAYVLSLLETLLPIISSRKNELDFQIKRDNDAEGKISSDTCNVESMECTAFIFVMRCIFQIIRCVLRCENTTEIDKKHFVQSLSLELVSVLCFGVHLPIVKDSLLCPTKNSEILEYLGHSAAFSAEILSSYEESIECRIKNLCRVHLQEVVNLFLQGFDVCDSEGDQTVYLNQLHVIASTSEGLSSLIEIGYPEWKENVSLRKDLAKPIFIIGIQALRQNSMTGSQKTLIADIFEIFLGLLDPELDHSLIVRGLSNMLMNIPHEVIREMDLSPQFSRFIHRVMHLEEHFSEERLTVLYGNVFQIILLCHHKGLLGSVKIAELLISQQPIKCSKLKESLKSVLRCLLAIKLNGENQVRVIRDCFAQKCDDTFCASMCEYIPVILSRHNPHRSWTELFECYLHLIGKFCADNSEIIDDQSEKYIFHASRNALRLAELISTLEIGDGEADALIERLFKSFPSNVSYQGVLYRMISSISAGVNEVIWGVINQQGLSHVNFRQSVLTAAGKLLREFDAKGIEYNFDFLRSKLAVMLMICSIDSIPMDMEIHFSFLRIAILRASASYQENQDLFLAALSIILLIIQRKNTTVESASAFAFLQMSLIPFVKENYAVSISPVICVALDVLILVYDKIPPKPYLEIMDDSEITHFLTTKSVLAEHASVHEYVLAATKLALGSSRRYVRQKAHYCRELYSISEA